MSSKTRRCGLNQEHKGFILSRLNGACRMKRGDYKAIVGPFQARFGFKPNITDVRRLLSSRRDARGMHAHRRSSRGLSRRTH
jgi:hypothetical protein